ncbi:MAG: glycosyltransferase family 39 protein [Chloroflexi bacterium]|nr:glycosyltransferase family 39 protein [Chloroflexota bacterium]
MAEGKRGNGRFWLTISLILLLAFALRVHNLTADAPLGVSPTLELSLDGPITIAAGRDMALFGDWSAFAGPRQAHIMYPLMNWLAFLFFRLLGVGYWSANFISVVTGLFSVAFIAGFARQQFSDRAALFSAFLLAINYIYINYNRDPMAYTTVACGMTFALYAWGRGLRQPFWFLYPAQARRLRRCLSSCPLFPFIRQPLLAFLWVIGQKRAWRNGRSYFPMLLFAAGTLLVVGAWTIFLYQPQPETVGSAYYARVVNPVSQFEDSVRTMIGSIFYMGVDFSLMARMLPLFILAYGYTFGRLVQLLNRRRLFMPAAEALLLAFLLSALAMLLVTFIRPLRFQIVLIPLMSLTAGIALDRLWREPPVRLPTEFSRLFPLLLYGGLVFFCTNCLWRAWLCFICSQCVPVLPAAGMRRMCRLCFCGLA